MSRPGTFLGAVALLCLACGDAADDTTNATGGPSTSQPSATGDTTDVAPTSTASETAVPTTTSSETTTAETTDPTSTTGPGELTPRAIIGGTFCTCVLWNDDTFRCWGKGEGLACTGWGEALLEDIGDDEVPALSLIHI